LVGRDLLSIVRQPLSPHREIMGSGWPVGGTARMPCVDELLYVFG
jgi:hypothetical protein